MAMNKCKCEWRGQRVIALCEAHEQAFRQRARNLMVSPETKRATAKQVQAVRERLRAAPYQVERGDMLYNAQGKSVAVVRDIDAEPVTIQTLVGPGIARQWIGGGTRLKIMAEGYLFESDQL